MIRLESFTPQHLDIAIPYYRMGIEWATCTNINVSDDAIAGALCALDSVWWLGMRDNGVAGLVGLEKIKWIDRVGEPYIAISPQERRKGVAVELGRLMMLEARNNLNFRRLQTTILTNAPSRGVLEKLNYRREGIYSKIRYKNGEYIDGIMYAYLME